MAHPIINVAIISFFNILFCVFTFAVSHTVSTNNCDVVDGKSPLVTAIYAVIVLGSLAGLVGVCRRVSWLLSLYLFSILVVLVLLFYSIVSDFVPIDDPGNWEKSRICLQEHETCKHINDSAFNGNTLPIESGCCKPPTSCGFIHQNGTVWKNPKKNINEFADKDCDAWSNDENKLCYYCNSCKAGQLAHKNKALKDHAVVKMIVTVLLMIALYMGWLARRNIIVDNEIVTDVKEPPYSRFSIAV